MKIINILGSPRKNGTRARIAGAFTETAAALGATVTDYYLNGMSISASLNDAAVLAHELPQKT